MLSQANTDAKGLLGLKTGKKGRCNRVTVRLESLLHISLSTKLIPYVGVFVLRPICMLITDGYLLYRVLHLSPKVHFFLYLPFPQWKTAFIIPFLKPLKDPFHLFFYRPNSLLSVLSKILEKKKKHILYLPVPFQDSHPSPGNRNMFHVHRWATCSSDFV